MAGRKRATMEPQLQPSETDDPGRFLAALRVVAPAQWRERVGAALTTHRSIPAAATALGVSATALRTWVKGDAGLAKIRVVGRGQPALADLDAAEIRELIAGAGGLDAAAAALATTPRRLDRYAARGALPERLAAQLREIADGGAKAH